MADHEEISRLREQIAWTVERCNAAMGDGFRGTPNSAVAAVCDELERLRAINAELVEAYNTLLVEAARSPQDEDHGRTCPECGPLGKWNACPHDVQGGRPEQPPPDRLGGQPPAEPPKRKTQ